MDGEAIFFTGRGRVGRGKAKNLRGGEHTACVSWLKFYAGAKEILICIALSEDNLLNINNLDRNQN